DCRGVQFWLAEGEAEFRLLMSKFLGAARPEMVALQESHLTPCRSGRNLGPGHVPPSRPQECRRGVAAHAHYRVRSSSQIRRDLARGIFRGVLELVSTELAAINLVPDISDRAAFAFDERGEFAFTSGYGITFKSQIKASPKFILAVLNSSLLDWYWKRISTPLRGGFYRYFTQFIEQLPIVATSPEKQNVAERL